MTNNLIPLTMDSCWETITAMPFDFMNHAFDLGDIAVSFALDRQLIDDKHGELEPGAAGTIMHFRFRAKQGNRYIAHGELACVSLHTSVFFEELVDLDFFHDHRHIIKQIADDQTGELQPLMGENLYWLRFEVLREKRGEGIGRRLWAEVHRYVRETVTPIMGRWQFERAFYDVQSRATLCMPMLDRLIEHNQASIPQSDRPDRHRVLGVYENNIGPALCIYDEHGLTSLPNTYSFALIDDKAFYALWTHLNVTSDVPHDITHEYEHDADSKMSVFVEVSTTADETLMRHIHKDCMRPKADKARLLASFFAGPLRDNPVLWPIITAEADSV